MLSKARLNVEQWTSLIRIVIARLSSVGDEKIVNLRCSPRSSGWLCGRYISVYCPGTLSTGFGLKTSRYIYHQLFCWF